MCMPGLQDYPGIGILGDSRGRYLPHESWICIDPAGGRLRRPLKPDYQASLQSVFVKLIAPRADLNYNGI